MTQSTPFTARHGSEAQMNKNPPKARAGSPGSTSAQLRDDIDRGRTGDKVDWADPAAAPLGTDDEAAGCAPRAEDVELARANETKSAVPQQRGRGPGAAGIF